MNATPLPTRPYGAGLQVKQSEVLDGLHSVQLPAGTIAVRMSANTFGGIAQASYAALRLDAPPDEAQGQPLVLDATRVMQRLLAGEVAYYFSPVMDAGQNGGGFSFITHQAGMAAPLDRARTLYLRTASAGGKLLDLVLQIDVDPAYVPAPPPAGDADGDRLVGYLRDIGAVPDSIDAWKTNAGIWPALKDLMRRCERGGADMAREGLL